MAEHNGTFDSLVRIDRGENVGIILEDRPDVPERHLANIRIIHEEGLDEMMDIHSRRFTVEDESMSYGEALTLLIALGVLSYLIYALIWPERF